MDAHQPVLIAFWGGHTVVSETRPGRTTSSFFFFFFKTRALISARFSSSAQSILDFHIFITTTNHAEGLSETCGVLVLGRSMMTFVKILPSIYGFLLQKIGNKIDKEGREEATTHT